MLQLAAGFVYIERLTLVAACCFQQTPAQFDDAPAPASASAPAPASAPSADEDTPMS